MAVPLHSRRDSCYQLVFWLLLGFPGSSAGEESARIAGNLGLIPGLGRSPGEGNGYPLQCSAWRIPWAAVCGVADSDTTEGLSLSLHCGSSNRKEPACNAGEQASTPGLESSSGEGNGSALQHPCLENSTDKEAWQATVPGVSRTRLGSSHTHCRWHSKCYCFSESCRSSNVH